MAPALLTAGPFPPVIVRPMMVAVMIDGAKAVPEFGGWACYDNSAHKWLSPDRFKSLVSAWFERTGADFSGNTFDDPAVMEHFAYSSDWADWEFLETPRDVSMGQPLKNDLNRIDQILDTSWERHRQRVQRKAQQNARVLRASM